MSMAQAHIVLVLGIAVFMLLSGLAKGINGEKSAGEFVAAAVSMVAGFGSALVIL